MHRNPLHSYTLTMKIQKEKLRNDPIHYCSKKNKIGKNLPKETKDLYIENYKTLMEKNQRLHK